MRAVATRLALAVTVALLAGAAAEARTLTVRGTDMSRYARIMLEFDQPTKVSARVTSAVVVLTFAKPATIKSEKLAAELKNVIALVRRDPDGTGLRLALTQPVRVNILEAGEKVFVDLLPPSWTGLPPGLPSDVVEALARRAREAEAKVRLEAERRAKQGPKPVAVRVSKLPTLTRLTFDAPPNVDIALETRDGETDVVFNAPLRLDQRDAKGQLEPAVLALSSEESEAALRVSLTLGSGYEARSFREDGAYIVDLAKPKLAETPSAATRRLQPDPPIGAPQPPAAQGAAPEASRPSTGNGAVAPAQGPAGPVRAAVTADADALAIHFPFLSRTPAAAFERGGIASLVFHTPTPIELGAWPAAAQPFADLLGAKREGAFTRVQFALKTPHLLRLAPRDAGWVVTIGKQGLVPSELIAPQRGIDETGRSIVTVPLAEASGVHWMESAPGGERIAVATASGAPRGVPKPHRFVEFTVLPSAHGLAVAAHADDLVVRPTVDGVSISRGEGLAVSPGESATLSQGEDPVVNRDRWMQDRLGATRQKERALFQAVLQAPPAERTTARAELARFLLANGSNPEASGVLAAAAADDPAFAQQRTYLLPHGIALARLGRDAEAKPLLSAEAIAEDPEAVLWRAALDAKAGRWSLSLVGFRRSELLLDRYPDELQAELRASAAQAAIEAKEFGFAEASLRAAGRVAPEGLLRDRVALLRARLDEASDRLDAAREAYGKLADTAARPVAAEAALRFVSVALREKTMGAEEAIARLETLSVVWRGDDIEAATLGALGRLYAESQRWREAFTMARRANRIFPDHPVTRALHEEAARLFEELFLTGKGESLSRVDALALYFDFKEFTPIGRRGDEIVRRLADRLIELDLLDQAGDLLKHQVDNRLSGAARATVAARLASVRLMDGKPQQALGALQDTRLPELPVAIKRARTLLEARALSDLSRTDLALQVLDGEEGPEVERLRADILWSGRRWRDAGEAHERLVGTRWLGTEALSDRDRGDVMRAAIAYSLGDEPLALDRLRTKFAAKMADSADARTFGFLTRPQIAGTREFREIARGVTSADTLADFLAEYRRRYPEVAVAERPRRPPEAVPPDSAATPQARAPGGPNRS